MGKRWFVVATATRQERRALEALEELGVTAYLPCEARFVRHARTKTRRESPLLPGYLFVELEEEDEVGLHAAAHADGVSRILSSGGRPRPVRTLCVGSLALLEALGAFDRTLPSAGGAVVRAGSQVKVSGGPLRGRVGLVRELRGRHRALVLLEALGLFGAGPMEVDLAHLAAA